MISRADLELSLRERDMIIRRFTGIQEIPEGYVVARQDDSRHWSWFHVCGAGKSGFMTAHRARRDLIEHSRRTLESEPEKGTKNHG